MRSVIVVIPCLYHKPRNQEQKQQEGTEPVNKEFEEFKQEPNHEVENLRLHWIMQTVR